MDISPLINRVARGKHGSQHLTQTEAESIFSELLKPDADELQLGAFLIAQRMKGETGAELAGFVAAARRRVDSFGTLTAATTAVDLPCYAGKRRGTHAYLAAALQARDQGIPVFVHGVESISGRITAWEFLRAAGVTRAVSLGEAMAVLQKDGIVYCDLAELCPDLHRLYHLRPRLGVRSFANTVARLLNPAGCHGQLNGFFHTPYADLMAEANSLLAQPRSLIFMGAEGEPELYADRQKLIVRQQADCHDYMGYDDAGFDAYPKQGIDPDQLAAMNALMLKGEYADREAAVIRRMLEAFEWASGKEMSNNWYKEA